MNELQIDSSKAIEFILTKGKDAELLKLALMLGENSDTKESLNDHLNLQNSDGGIPFQMRSGSLSTIGPTITFFKDFLILDMKDEIEERLMKAVNFLLMNQHEEGFFEEPQSIKNFEPSIWETPGTDPNRIYCTAIVTNFLLSLMDDSYRNFILKGIEYLSRNWRDDTGFKSYPHALWNAIPTFIATKGEDDSISRRGLEMLQTFNLDNYPSSSIVWMIESFINAGLENHRFVTRLVNVLLERQTLGGKWESEDGEDYDATTTLTVLLVLKKLKYI
jgi:hypothetical protein